MMNCVGALLWAIILITVAFPIAGICATVYIILYAISGCIPGCEGCAETLLKGIQLPGYAVRKVVHCEC